MWKKRVFRICHYSMKLYLTYIWPVLTLSEIEMDIRSKVFATRFPSWITSWILFHSSGHSLRRHPVATEEQRRRQASTHLESDLEEAALRPEGTGAANVHVRVIDSLQQTHKVGAVILKRNKKRAQRFLTMYLLENVNLRANSVRWWGSAARPRQRQARKPADAATASSLLFKQACPN